MSEFKCSVCNKVYLHHRNLRRHVKISHNKPNEAVPSLKREPLQWFFCESCPTKYRNSSNLKAHIVKEHGISVTRCRLKPSFNCSLRCGYTSNERSQLFLHLKTDHDIDVETVVLSFSDYRTFLSWKEETEYRTTSKFIVSAPRYTSKLKTKYYFSCHRSGNFVSGSKGLVHLKKQGSKKINGFCPASLKITVDKSTGRCEVEFVKTHVGHSNDLGHLSLSAKDREYIALKIAANVPFDTILKELHENLRSTRDRVKLVTRKDLHNIKSSLKSNKLFPSTTSEETCSVLSKRQQNLQSRHEKSLQMSAEEVLRDGESWLVPTEEDSTEFHQIQKTLKTCDGCSSLCSDCNTCVHMYTCTCLDYRIRRSMCEHIHLVCRSSLLNSSDENNSVFQDIFYVSNDHVTTCNTEQVEASSAHGRDSPEIFPSLDARKTQLLGYFQEILASVDSMEELDVISEMFDKMKSAICTVHSKLGTVNSTVSHVSGNILEIPTIES